MRITSIENRKTTNLTIKILLFMILFSFCTSTLTKTTNSLNLNKDIILEKLNSGDLSVINKIDIFCFLRFIYENQKLKSLEKFNETLSLKIIIKIYLKVKDQNYKNFPVEKMDEILKIFIIKISENSVQNLHNKFLYRAIFYLIGIYSQYENSDLNFESFNEKIIPIIYKIINKDNNKYRIGTNNSAKYNVLNNCINVFKIFTKRKFFFNNLEKNIKLKELFINIINEYTSIEKFGLKELNNDKDKNIYLSVIDNFFNFYGLDNIMMNYYHKKVFFEIIDYFLENFIKIFNNGTFNDRSYLFMQLFLNRLFENQYYYENINDFDYITNIFSKIANYEFQTTKNEVNSLLIYTIVFYTKNIATFSEEKYSKLIRKFEENIKKYITLINSFQITQENSNYSYGYNKIEKYLYDSNINFENEKFSNPNLINNIKKSFYKYIIKIVLFELEKIDFKVTELHYNYIIQKFLLLGNKELEKYDFKNIMSYKVIKRLEQLNIIFKNLRLSEYIFLTSKDKNFLEFGFLHDLINMNEIRNINIVLKFLENYKYNISKSINSYIDSKFFINLSYYIKNLVGKLDLEKNLTNYFLEKLNRLLGFETEIKEFVDNKNEKDFKKLSIVKFLYSIKESKLENLKNLEELNDENFKVFMINFVNDFKKLYDYYDTKNNYSNEFKETVYIDFREIFNTKNSTQKIFWRKTDKTNTIYNYFMTIFPFFDINHINEYESKLKKQRIE